MRCNATSKARQQEKKTVLLVKCKDSKQPRLFLAKCKRKCRRAAA